MIELIASENDDIAFLQLAQRIVNGAVGTFRASEVYLTHIDNWFDHKWLGFWSSWKNQKLKDLCVPPFNPNRIRSQKHFLWDASSSRWTSTTTGKPLHRRQPGRRDLYVQRLNRMSKSGAFIWYSGNTVTNGAGSLMLYLSCADDYAWYASFRKGELWKISDEFHITRRELESFEESGRQMELVPGTVD